jgi:type I restriction enzyme S subunit
MNPAKNISHPSHQSQDTDPRGGAGKHQRVAVKRGWESKKLAAVSAINYGYTESASSEAVGPRFLRITDIQDDHVDWESVPYCKIEPADLPKYHLATGDIVFARTGATTGKSFLVKDPPEAVFASYLIRLRLLDAKLLPEFVSLFFQTAGYWQSIKDGSSGSAQGGFNATKLGALRIPVPPLPEQQRIVGILEEAFVGIATAKANAEKNLQNARALFESHLNAVFSQRGEGWVEKKLVDKSLLEIIDGDRGVNYPKASDFCDEGHCLFLNTKNVRPDGFDFESTMFITAEKDGRLRKGKLKRDDVVLTTRGTIGNIGLYSADVPFDHIRINSGMLIFRPNKCVLLPSYLFELLRSIIVKEQIRKQTTGAAQPQLPIKTLVNFTIPVLTDLNDQEAVVKKLRAFEPETRRLSSIYERKLAALEALKKSLLHQAFAGEL